MNKFITIILTILTSTSFLLSQDNILPKGFQGEEKILMDSYLNHIKASQDVITTPPNFSVRTMAEWEEIQALTIAWEGFEPILTEIVRNSVDQCKVLIACDNPDEVDSYLEYYNVNTFNNHNF